MKNITHRIDYYLALYNYMVNTLEYRYVDKKSIVSDIIKNLYIPFDIGIPVLYRRMIEDAK